MAEQVPLLVDAATKTLRQFNPDETMPKEQLSAALQLVLAGVVLDDSTGIAATDTILKAMGKLQAQVNQKETPAGALAQMRAFGIGAVAGASPTPDLLTHTTGGNFTANASVSAAAGLPLSTLQHSITYVPGVNAATGALEATALTGNPVNGVRKWFNKRNGGILLGWREHAFLDSPAFTGSPSVPNLKIGNVPGSDANTLDFLDKAGTFTVSLVAQSSAGTVTYSARAGRYIRIANRVFWTLRLDTTSIVGAVGTIRLSGFPFLVVNNSAAVGGVGISFIQGLNVANIAMVNAIHVGGTDSIQLYKFLVGAEGNANLNAADISSGVFRLYMHGNYEIA